MKELGLDLAAKLVQNALGEAKSRDVNVSVAVVDAAGRLVAFSRMDGALPASAELARVKAESTLLFGMPTQDMAAASALIPAFSRPVAFVGGGFPLRQKGTVVGALGVAGGMPDQDHELAAAVAKQL